MCLQVFKEKLNKFVPSGYVWKLCSKSFALKARRRGEETKKKGFLNEAVNVSLLFCWHTHTHTHSMENKNKTFVIEIVLSVAAAVAVIDIALRVES